MEIPDDIRDDLKQIHAILHDTHADLENLKHKFGVKDIRQPDASLSAKERIRLPDISEDIVAAYLQTRDVSSFLMHLADKRWVQDNSSRKIVAWLKRPEQRPWLTFLMFATTGTIRDEVVALVGALMHARTTV